GAPGRAARGRLAGPVHRAGAAVRAARVRAADPPALRDQDQPRRRRRLPRPGGHPLGLRRADRGRPRPGPARPGHPGPDRRGRPVQSAQLEFQPAPEPGQETPAKTTVTLALAPDGATGEVTLPALASGTFQLSAAVEHGLRQEFPPQKLTVLPDKPPAFDGVE